MESNSEPGRIQISRSTYERVHDLSYEWEERRIDVKGKGLCQTYLLKPEYHVDPLNIETQQLTDPPIENVCSKSIDLLKLVGRDSSSRIDDMMRNQSTTL